jgi:protein phosphatase
MNVEKPVPVRYVPMHLKLAAADRTDVGRQREQNEDYAYKRIESTEEGDKGLFIVADGMGGYEAGEVASKLAVETISRALDSFFKPIPDQPTIQLDLNQTVPIATPNNSKPDQNQTRKLTGTPSVPAIEERLRTAIQQANRDILRYGERQPASRGLGSTITTVLIQGEQAYIANVGDSRTYLLRDHKLKALTRDHSLVQRLVEANQITPEAVYTHPQRNVIYRSLGAGHKNIEVDIFSEIVQPGDIFLLCSDGLWEMVRHQDLEKVLNTTDHLEKLCDKLIALANQNGGEDNITAVLAQVCAV